MSPEARRVRARLLMRLRGLAGIGALAGLAACASGVPTPTAVPVTQEAATYRSHAKSYYAPPGPADDPWGPYIEEASKRFDVPDAWIRAVMDRESGGRLFASDGSFVTSVPGAMGLMQLMPPTYDDMRAQYGLGEDAFDPRDNILAGTAYIRQMYDIYGSPGFLAAYNDGPGMLDRYLRQNRALPRETRRYVAAIGPQIVGIWPSNRSAADLMVAQHDTHAIMYASAQTTDATRNIRAAWAHQRANNDDQGQPVQVAEAPDVPVATPGYAKSWQPVSPAPAPEHNAVAAAWAARGTSSPAPTQVADASDSSDDAQTSPAPQAEPVRPAWVSGARASAQPIPAAAPIAAQPAMATLSHPAHYGFHLVTPAMAESSPLLRTNTALSHPRQWSIQVGAFNSAAQATQAAGHAHASLALAAAHSQVAPVRTGRAQLYRARLTGLSHDDAVAACRRLGHNSPCVVVSPT
jgi:hypothetical protein